MPRDSSTQKIQLYEDITKAVLTLELVPGQDLDEASLSATYGLSRTPLREIFRQLAGEGYVTLHQNRGARVSEMSHKTMRDFFLVAPMIYSSILRLAAENARPHQIEDLKDAQAEFKNALRSGTVAAKAIANYRFHAITGEMADNVFLLPTFNRLLIDHARMGMTFYKPRDNNMAESISKACDQHDEIIASIEAADSDRAAQLAQEHWNLSRDQIEQFAMPRSLDADLDFAGAANAS